MRRRQTIRSHDSDDVSPGSSGSSSDSSDSYSDVSSEDGSSDVSDFDKFEEAYSEFRKLTASVNLRELERHVSGQSSEDVPGLALAGARICR